MKVMASTALTEQLVKRKLSKIGPAPGVMKLRYGKPPSLDATPDRKPLLKSVFSGYK